MSPVIMGLELPRSTAINTGKIKLLIDLLMGYLIHEVLNSGIKITRVFIAVGLK